MALIDLFKLDGKAALVTGGGTGLGKSMAEALAEAGSNVVLVGRREDIVIEAASEISKKYRRGALAISADVSNEDDVKTVVDRTINEFGSLDVVIANAGIGGHEGMFPDIDTWKSKLDSHLTGTYLTIKEAAKVMIPQGKGKIITISSMRGLIADIHGETPAYSAAKAAIISLTQSFAVSLGKHGIQVNCIAPGPFGTERIKRIFESENSEHKILAAEYLKRIPAHRVGEPDEIKGLALFLASKASDYITGAIIPIDGGYTAH